MTTCGLALSTIIFEFTHCLNEERCRLGDISQNNDPHKFGTAASVGKKLTNYFLTMKTTLMVQISGTSDVLLKKGVDLFTQVMHGIMCNHHGCILQCRFMKI